MKPFGFFLGAAVVLLGLGLFDLLTPGSWASDFYTNKWISFTDLTLSAVMTLAGVLMVRVYGEARWIVASLTISFVVAVFYALYDLLYAVNDYFPDLWYYVEHYSFYLRMTAFWAAGILHITALLCVRSPDLRGPFRWLGLLGILGMGAVIVLTLFTIEHWPHPSFDNTLVLVSLPAQLISIRLNYRFWKGDLGRTAGWEKEVQTLGLKNVL